MRTMLALRIHPTSHSASSIPIAVSLAHSAQSICLLTSETCHLAPNYFSSPKDENRAGPLESFVSAAMIPCFRSLANRFEINLLFNLAGTGWTALLLLLFIPQYINLMGVEAYGVVGLYLTLQGVLQLFDFGLSPTMNREMARYSVQPERAGEARDFARTVELGYWALGLLIGTAIGVAAHFIATQWVNAKSLPVSVVEQSIILMGVLTILQWPMTLYHGGLMGLQRQPALNALQIVLSTLNNGGAFLVLWLVSPTITAFLIWQIMVNALRIVLVARLFWRSLPPIDRKPRINPKLIHPVWHFAAGMSGITLSAIVLSQLDKVILSKLLSLETFGFYTLATVIGNGLTLVITAIFNVIFPRLAALATLGDAEAEKRFYHRAAQVMSVAILPVATLIAFFSFDILLVWTNNPEVARNVAPIAGLLVVGTALNGLMNLPYALQLAHGWTSLGLRLNAFFIILFVPALVWMTNHYGVTGAALMWVILNGIYVVLGAPLTHRRLLNGEMWRWFFDDVLLPCAGAALVVGVGRWFFSPALPTLTAVVALAGLWVGAILAAGLAAAQVRAWAFTRLTRAWSDLATFCSNPKTVR